MRDMHVHTGSQIITNLIRHCSANGTYGVVHKYNEHVSVVTMKQLNYTLTGPRCSRVATFRCLFSACLLQQRTWSFSSCCT